MYVLSAHGMKNTSVLTFLTYLGASVENKG